MSNKKEIKINIPESVKDTLDMVNLLRRIADMIEEGYTSGYDPDWSLTGDLE
jgi:hypothetical protein